MHPDERNDTQPDADWQRSTRSESPNGTRYVASGEEEAAGGNKLCGARIMLVSDDEQFRMLLCELLTARNFKSVVGVDNATALAQRGRLLCDVAVVDTTSSYIDTVGVFRRLQRKRHLSVIVLASKSSDSSYGDAAATGEVVLYKPFHPRELEIALRGILRRAADDTQRPVQDSLSVGPVTLQPLLNTALVAAREVALTDVERRILHELLLNADQPVTRERLMRCGLLRVGSPHERVLDTHINHLRRKIGRDEHDRTPIRTVRPVGYLLLASWRPETR